VLKIDTSEIITKQQLDDKIKSDTGLDIATLIELSIIKENEYTIIIFDNITNDMNSEALNYLRQIPITSNQFNKSTFYIFISNFSIKQFNDIKVKLKSLSVNETKIILRKTLPQQDIPEYDIQLIHDYSEGVFAKLEQIISLAECSSIRETLDQENIFKGINYSDSIPKNILANVKRLKEDKSKEQTFIMMQILSILKNGETLSNLKRTKIGSKLTPINSRELTQLGLASTIYIDQATTIIRLNVLIKDYVLSIISDDDINKIAYSYLGITIYETKDGIKINSTNRKIIECGYNTDDDNGTTLLKYSICKLVDDINDTESVSDENNPLVSSLNKVIYLSHAYVYNLSNASRFKETITATLNLIEATKSLTDVKHYKYYYHLAYSQRMLGDNDSALENLRIASELCDPMDKQMLSNLLMEKLLILERTDIDNAYALANKIKKEFKSTSSAFLTANEILCSQKNKAEQIKILTRLEKRARKLHYNTLANNILFRLNKEESVSDKLTSIDTIIKTDSSEYNVCRAIIDKFMIITNNNEYSKIKDSDIEKLKRIYNYLYYQRLDILFNRCHEVLWRIAENRQNSDVLIFIYVKGTLIWQLTYDTERENKYKDKMSQLEGDANLFVTENGLFSLMGKE
jgi:hypothetical protein